MAVFVVTAPDGTRSVVVADDLEEARVEAIRLLQIPFTQFRNNGGTIVEESPQRNRASNRSETDGQIIRRLGIPTLEQAARPTATARTARGNQQITVDPITGQSILAGRTSGGLRGFNALVPQQTPQSFAQVAEQIAGPAGTTRLATQEGLGAFPFEGSRTRANQAAAQSAATQPTVTQPSVVDPAVTDPDVQPGREFTFTDGSSRPGLIHPAITFVRENGGRVRQLRNDIAIVETTDGRVLRIHADGSQESLGASPEDIVDTVPDPENDANVVNVDTHFQDPIAAPEFQDVGALETDPLTDDLLPEAVFRRFLRNRGVTPGGTGAFLAQQQLGPALNAFGNLNTLGLLPEQYSFTNFLNSGTLGPSRFGPAARIALENLDPTAIANAGDILGSGGTFTRPFENIANLAMLAATGARSPLGRDLGGFNTERLQQFLQDQALAGTGPTPQSFAQYAFDLFRGNRQRDPRLAQLGIGV